MANDLLYRETVSLTLRELRSELLGMGSRLMGYLVFAKHISYGRGLARNVSDSKFVELAHVREDRVELCGKSRQIGLRDLNAGESRKA
jgi:hypothetical protein